MGIEFVDQSEAARQMGRDAYLIGDLFTSGAHVFDVRSEAYRHWCEGWLQADRVAKYRSRYTLDTPARVYDNIASRIRGGDAEADVLADYGLMKTCPNIRTGRNGLSYWCALAEQQAANAATEFIEVEGDCK